MFDSVSPIWGGGGRLLSPIPQLRDAGQRALIVQVECLGIFRTYPGLYMKASGITDDHSQTQTVQDAVSQLLNQIFRPDTRSARYLRDHRRAPVDHRRGLPVRPQEHSQTLKSERIGSVWEFPGHIPVFKCGATEHPQSLFIDTLWYITIQIEEPQTFRWKDDATFADDDDRQAAVDADLKEIAFRASKVFAAQRKARQAFFKNVFENTSWRWTKLEKMDLSGAAASADLDSRRFHAFMRQAFAMALASGEVSECDLPNRDEIYEYYWLFVFQTEWECAETSGDDDSKTDEQHRPVTRSHAKALKQCVQDCDSSSDRVFRFREMQENITGRDASQPLTARMIKRLGSQLVVKPDLYDFRQRPKQWRDLETHRPTQSKANDALDQLHRTLSAGNLPDAAAKAIRKAIAVFSDDRQIMLAVDGEGLVVGGLARTRHYYGFMEQFRTRERGPRGGRGTTGMPVHIFKLNPEWSVVPVDVQLIEWADSFKAFRDNFKVSPPPDFNDNVLIESLVVMPNQSKALDHIQHASKVGFTLQPVPLPTIKKWLVRGEDITGRHWEDVADEVFEILTLMHGEDTIEDASAA